MGRRRSVYVRKRVPFTGPPSPNSTVDAISIDLRVFWPPNADRRSVALALLAAVNEAAELIDADALGPRLPGNVWLVPPPEWEVRE